MFHSKYGNGEGVSHLNIDPVFCGFMSWWERNFEFFCLKCFSAENGTWNEVDIKCGLNLTWNLCCHPFPGKRSSAGWHDTTFFSGKIWAVFHPTQPWIHGTQKWNHATQKWNHGTEKHGFLGSFRPSFSVAYSFAVSFMWAPNKQTNKHGSFFIVETCCC